MKIIPGMVAVITGGADGMGRGVANLLASKGCHLALADINTDLLAKAKKELESDNDIKVSTHRVDVSNQAAMQTFVDEVIAEHGKVNIVHNNAGITLQKSFATHSLDDWNRVIGVNLWGVIYGCNLFLPALRKAGASEGAHIVNMSSMAGFIGMPGQSSYAATKAGVKTLSESLFSELADDGIGVTSVHPGAIKTNMILATLEDSDDVAKAKKNYEMVGKIGKSVEYAAQKIVDGIERDKQRVRIGRDSVMVDIIMRLAPQTLVKQMVKLARKIRS